MVKFVVKRILYILIVLLMVSFVLFMLFRTMSVLTEEGRDEFVEHFIVYMEHLTYELFTLPFNMALVHDFFPHDVQNWNNTGIWGWPEVVQRLYRTR